MALRCSAVREDADALRAQPVDVEVSIVTLGALDRLAVCVGGLAGACDGVSWRLTIIDNAPQRQDLAPILAAAPSTTVIRSEGRRGFGANHNLVLMPRINDGQARYVLVLNDDTELDPNAVAALVRYADAQPDVGLVGARVRDASGRYESPRMPWPSLWQEAARAALPRLRRSASRSSGWLEGPCMLLRTTALREVGPFDPAFFLFYEDTDLCLRMVRRGWRLGLAEEAALVHHAHHTISRINWDAQVERQVLRSQYLYFEKHHGRLAARALSYFVRGAIAVRTAKMLIEGVACRDRVAADEAGTLWALARCHPGKPTLLESEACRDAAAAAG